MTTFESTSADDGVTYSTDIQILSRPDPWSFISSWRSALQTPSLSTGNLQPNSPTYIASYHNDPLSLVRVQASPSIDGDSSLPLLRLDLALFSEFPLNRDRAYPILLEICATLREDFTTRNPALVLGGSPPTLFRVTFSALANPSHRLPEFGTDSEGYSQASSITAADSTAEMDELIMAPSPYSLGRVQTTHPTINHANETDHEEHAAEIQQDHSTEHTWDGSMQATSTQPTAASEDTEKVTTSCGTGKQEEIADQLSLQASGQEDLASKQTMDTHTVSASSLEIRDDQPGEVATNNTEFTTTHNLPIHNRKVYDIDTLLAIGRESKLSLAGLKFSNEVFTGDIFHNKRSDRHTHDFEQLRMRGLSSYSEFSRASEEDMLSRCNEPRLVDHIYRHPKAPPRTVLGQRNEGFVRFLKQHASPSHQRVTAGGRIVPVDPLLSPPPFSLEVLLGRTKQSTPVYPADVAHKRTLFAAKYHQKSRSRSVSLKGFETAALGDVNQSNSDVATQPIPNPFPYAYNGLTEYGSHQSQLFGQQTIPTYAPPIMQLPAGAVLNCMLADGAALVTFNGKLYRASMQTLANGLHMVMEPLDTGRPFPQQPAVVPMNAAFPHTQLDYQYGPVLQPEFGPHSYMSAAPMANPFNPGLPDSSVHLQLQIAQTEYNFLRAQLVNVDKQMAMYRQEMTPQDHASTVATRVQLVQKLDDARTTKNRLQNLITSNAPSAGQGLMPQTIQMGAQYGSYLDVASGQLLANTAGHCGPAPQLSYVDRVSYQQYDQSPLGIDQKAHQTPSTKASHNLSKNLSPNAPPFVPSNINASNNVMKFQNNIVKPIGVKVPAPTRHSDVRFNGIVSTQQQPEHQVPTSAAESKPRSLRTAPKTSWDIVEEELRTRPKTPLRETKAHEKWLTEVWSPKDPLFDSVHNAGDRVTPSKIVHNPYQAYVDDAPDSIAGSCLLPAPAAGKVGNQQSPSKFELARSKPAGKENPAIHMTDDWSARPLNPLMDSKNEVNLAMTGEEADELAWGPRLTYKQHQTNVGKANVQASTLSSQSNQECRSEYLGPTKPHSLERGQKQWASDNSKEEYDRSDPQNALRNLIRSPPSFKSRKYDDEHPFAGFGLSASQLLERERKLWEAVGTEEDYEEAEAYGKGANDEYGSQGILRKMLKSPEFSTARVVGEPHIGKGWWSALKETTNTSAHISSGTPKASKQGLNATSPYANRDNHMNRAYKAPSSLGSSNYNACGMLPQYNTSEASTRSVEPARTAQYHSHYDAVGGSTLYNKTSTQRGQFLPQFDGPGDTRDSQQVADTKLKKPASGPTKKSSSQKTTKDMTTPADPFALYRHNKDFPPHHHTAVDRFFRTIREEETQQMMTPW